MVEERGEINAQRPGTRRYDYGVDLPNELLRESDLPAADRPVKELLAFGLTFDGYGHCGSAEKCAEIANARRRGKFTEVRTCLFFEQRRWRFQGNHGGMTADDEAYMGSSVEAIRSFVAG